jgi:hypothetical protein
VYEKNVDKTNERSRIQKRGVFILSQTLPENRRIELREKLDSLETFRQAPPPSEKPEEHTQLRAGYVASDFDLFGIVEM